MTYAALEIPAVYLSGRFVVMMSTTMSSYSVNTNTTSPWQFRHRSGEELRIYFDRASVPRLSYYAAVPILYGPRFAGFGR
jgi:hypothetical protein